MWSELLFRLFLAALTVPAGSAETASDRVLLPIEVFEADGAAVGRTVTLAPAQSESVRSLWLQVHGLRYPEQASVQVNTSAWIPLKDDTVTVAEPGKTYGGIGGGFVTLALTLHLPDGTVVAGANTVRFRFNHSDGLASGYRVIAWNFLTKGGSKVLAPADFVRMRLEPGHPHCRTALPFKRASSSGVMPLCWPAASKTVRRFRRTVRTAMHTTDGT